jgi:predicted metal-dependent hydrolase
MKVRHPKLSYGEISPHWAKNPNFAHEWNAMSLVPAYIEPYLIQVMLRAKGKLPDSLTTLHREVGIFIRQEAQHCKQHLAFNDMMRRHYPGMEALEKEYEADYLNWLKNKSLKFHLAYSEGFEALGAEAAQVFFEELDEELSGADPRAVELWRWHLAEEFEHRTVCFDMYKTLYCRGFYNKIVNGYFYRVWAFLFARKHIFTHVVRLAQFLHTADNAKLPAQQAAQAWEALAAYAKRGAARQRGVTRRVLAPWYNPRFKRMPRGLEAYLEGFDQNHPSAAGRPSL